jgi:hypothetical protein
MTKNEQASRIRQRLAQLASQLARELEAARAQKKLLRGYVYHSKRRCGKPSCRCAQGQLHDAWVVATTVDGKRTTRSLPPGMRQRVDKLATSYRRFREVQRQFRKHTSEALQLMQQLEELLRVSVFEEPPEAKKAGRKK